MKSTWTFTEQQLSVGANAVRSYDAVVVVGAGLSAYGYPMTAELPALLWQAIEEVPLVPEELRRRVGRPGSVKEVLGSAADSVQVGWQLAREFPAVRTAFQDAFTSLDADREPSQAHFDLARLIHLRRVECVISYNWDSCLERAYEKTFGVPLPPGVLHKPHGDVGVPDGRWTFPDEAGLVPDSLLRRLAKLRDRPRALLVVGYSGSDEIVVEKLLAPLESRSPVVRVGPSASGEGAIPGTADMVLSALLHELEPMDFWAGWRYVTFHRSRDFAAALRGERLRPVDVDACPELPAASRLASRLRSSKFATVSGVSGSGKSITAFHAARRLNQDGWAIVELSRPGVAQKIDVTQFRRLPGPVLAVVDDAQAIDPEILADFEASVDSQHAVLLVSTERLETRDDEMLIASQGQQIIFDYCKANIDEVGALLSRLDDRVAKSAFKETPLQRLEMAHKTTKEPWVFMFVASGGDQRIAGAIDRAVSLVHPGLIFGLICVAQMTTQDAGITRTELANSIIRFAPEAFVVDGQVQQDLVETALRFLTEERLVGDHNGRLRASHIRVADRALRDLGQRKEADTGSIVLECVRQCLLDPEISIIGKFWLFRTFDRSDAYRYKHRESFLDDSVVSALLAQCRSVPPGRERGVALNLIWSVNFIRHLSETQAESLAEDINKWIPDIRAEEANGFRWILSGLRSWHKDAYSRVHKTVSARTLGHSISHRGSRVTAMDWAAVIQELAPMEGADFSAWRQEFEAGIDKSRLAEWLGELDSRSHPFQVYDLIDTLAGVAPAVATHAFKASAPNMVACMEKDLADSSSNIMRWTIGIMYLVADLAPATGSDEDDDVGEPDISEPMPPQMAFLDDGESELRELAAVVLASMRQVDWAVAAQSLARKELYQLEGVLPLLYWLGRLSLEIIEQIADAIPIGWLDGLTLDDGVESASDERNRIEQICHFLLPLSWGPRGEVVVRSFLEKHEVEIDIFPFLLISRFPDIAAQRALEGKPLEMRSPRGSDWSECTLALKAVTAVDIRAGRTFLNSSLDKLREAIENPQSFDLKGIAKFIEIADDLDPRALDALIERLDMKTAQEKWTQPFTSEPSEICALLRRASRVAGDIGNLALKLLDEPQCNKPSSLS